MSLHCQYIFTAFIIQLLPPGPALVTFERIISKQLHTISLSHRWRRLLSVFRQQRATIGQNKSRERRKWVLSWFQFDPPHLQYFSTERQRSRRTTTWKISGAGSNLRILYLWNVCWSVADRIAPKHYPHNVALGLGGGYPSTWPVLRVGRRYFEGS